MPTTHHTSDTTANTYRTERGRVLAQALEAQRAGLPPELVELSEGEVFPYIIPCSVRTGRDSRRTGVLLGLPAPVYVKRGRAVFYRLSDITAWLSQGETYRSTAAHLAGQQAGANDPANA